MNPLVSITEAWETFLANGQTNTIAIAPPILRSWERCRRAQLDPYQLPHSAQHDGEFIATLDQERLCTLARPSMEDLYQFVEGSGFAVVLFDPALLLVDTVGDEPMVATINQLALGIGQTWSEQRIGTMAVNLALHEAIALQTRAAEHFYQAYHHLACSAAPLFDINGQAIGVIGVLGPDEAAHAHTLGMVIAAAQAIHTQLRNNLLLAETNDHLADLSAVVEAMNEGIIFIDAHRVLSKMNARAGQILGVSPRAITGRSLDELGVLPATLQAALDRREELADQELLFNNRRGPVAALCNLRSIWDRGRHYRGALVTLRPPESVQRLVQQVVGARARFTFADILGESKRMQIALRHARIAAYSPSPALLAGEAGVGKELFGHAIHSAGSRADGPFIVLNCAAMPRSLLLGELVGYEEQAHPDRPGRPGKIELAQGGTLLLEEVEALSPEAQTSLLRVIETGHLIRIGGRRVVPCDTRIIATTNTQLQQDVAQGRFRAELLYRLSVIAIEIPPLRERGDDVLLLVTQMLAAMNQRIGKHTMLAPDALAALVAYPWPGNVRELEAILERLMHLTEKSVLTLEDLPQEIARCAPGAATPPRLQDRHALAEREAILRACRETGGHLGRAAERLGVSRATLWRKMKLYDIEREQLWQA